MPNTIKLTPSLCGCSPIQIGYRVENDARAIEFDFTEWSDEYGSGAVELLVKRKGDQAAYPVALEIDGTVATWVISDTDTSVPGYGKAEYTYTVGTTLAKTAVFTFFVAEDLGGTTQDPPDPYQTWVDTLTSLGAETLGNAIRAEEAADRAEDAQAAAEQTVSEAAQYAQEASESATAAAQSAGAARDMAASALSSADRATASATAASGHATAAEAAKDLAISAAEDAQHSETQAELSASAAAESAESASGSAAQAQQSATNAATSALHSANNAAQAIEAASDAEEADRIATNAATSATQSASNASQSASAASGSATQAASSATNAAASATSAASSATAAATSETNAAQSATSAEASAQEAATEAAKLNNYLPTDTASGSIASFSDGADSVPLEALTVSLEPIQNLNGQTSPYPAGGGVNKLPQYAEDEKFGVTMTPLDNGMMKFHGTVTTAAWMNFGNTFTLEELGIAVGDTVRVSSSTRIYGFFADDNDTNLLAIDTANYPLRTVPSGATKATLYLYAKTSIPTVGEVIDTAEWFQLEKGSTATPFAPYSNLCPITGHTAAQVWRSGINVWDEEWVNGFINDSGVFTARNDIVGTKNAISVKPNTTYAFVRPNVQGFVTFWKKAEAYNELVTTDFISRSSLAASVGTFTTPDNCYAVHFNLVAAYGSSYANNVSVNYPSTNTAYIAHEPIVHISIPLGQTVYGGTLDVVGGKVVVDRAGTTIDALSWTYNATYKRMESTSVAGVIKEPLSNGTVLDGLMSSAYTPRPATNTGSSPINGSIGVPVQKTLLVLDEAYTDVTRWLTDMGQQQIVYPLAEPIEISLTDIPELTTLYGTNNIWSDSGDVSVEYRADIQRYISKVIAEALA